MTTKEAVRDFSTAVNRVAFGREHIVLTRRGRPVAVLVPIGAVNETVPAGADREPSP